MSVLAPSDVTAYLGEDTERPRAQVALDAAEALCAAYIGTDALAERVAVADSVTVTRTKSIIQVNDGPIRVLTSIDVGTTSYDIGDATHEAWLVAHPTGFSIGVTVALVYTAGYTSANMPARIREAVLRTAVHVIDGGGRGVSNEGVQGFATAGAEWATAMPPGAMRLLRTYRRPEMSA